MLINTASCSCMHTADTVTQETGQRWTAPQTATTLKKTERQLSVQQTLSLLPQNTIVSCTAGSPAAGGVDETNPFCATSVELGPPLFYALCITLMHTKPRRIPSTPSVSLPPPRLSSLPSPSCSSSPDGVPALLLRLCVFSVWLQPGFIALDRAKPHLFRHCADEADGKTHVVCTPNTTNPVGVFVCYFILLRQSAAMSEQKMRTGVRER